VSSILNSVIEVPDGNSSPCFTLKALFDI